MGAREIIAAAAHDHGLAFPTPEQVADHTVKALTAAGYRIIGPGDLDRETLERAAEVADTYPQRDPAEDGNGYWAAEEIATAIRALAGKAGEA